VRKVVISSDGEHESSHPYTHLVHAHLPDLGINNRCMLVNLDGVQHSILDTTTFNDPNVARVEWGPVLEPGVGMVERGVIIYRDRLPERRCALPERRCA